MDKYSVTYICGHEGRVDIGGPTKDRQRKADWMASFKCDACATADKEAEHALQSQTAAEAAKELSLPELTGSLKQVAYAETCRMELIDRINAVLKNLSQKLSSDDVRLTEDLRKQGMQVEIDLKRTLSYISTSKTTASWWIDRKKEVMDSRTLKEFTERIVVELERVEYQDPTKSTVASKDDTASIVRPEEPVTETIATVRVVEQVVEVHFSEKREDLRELVKSLGYTWDQGRWARTITYKAGDVSDRAAEAGHRLLAAGFIVSLADDTIRNKAMAAEYLPERTRWVTTIVDHHDTYPRWFFITWGKEDDLYAAARKIRGAKYLRPGIVIPPRHFAEVLDFAEQHDFSLSPSADKAVAVAREHRQRELMIDVKEPEATQGVKAPNKPAALQAPDMVDIDHDLRED